ncbi:MAG: hypothetical protein Q9197_005909 [Variospora fuerteventurae]
MAYTREHRSLSSLFLVFWLRLAVVLATPLSQAVKISRRAVIIPNNGDIWNHSTQSNRSDLVLPPTLPRDIRVLNYNVPDTNVDMEFILFLRDPIEASVLKQALGSGVFRVRDRLLTQGDDWLPRRDDPYFSIVPGKCIVRIESVKTASGRSSMTYKTLLAAFVGMWNLLHVEDQDWEASFRIQVAGLTAGHGTVRVPELPGPEISGE